VQPPSARRPSYRRRPTLDCDSQPNGLDYVRNFNRVGGLPVLREELVRRGYFSVDIAKIFGGNWMRVFREAWNS
jgi:microsomal dipeptidase-like Zn-dependent dipeptidase